MPAHLAPIRLDEFRIADASVHFELCIAFCQVICRGGRRTMPRAQRRLHVRKLESRQAEPPCFAREYFATRGRNTLARPHPPQLAIHDSPRPTARHTPPP